MSERTFDPEVAALLREVARDSGSTLLRLPKEPLVKWVGRPEEVVSPRGSHLSKVEKHLVEAYREEAAWVLEQACIAQLKRLPLVFTSSTTDAKLLESKAKRLIESEGAEMQEQPDLVLIAEGREVDPVRLGVSSLRLAPADSGRNTLAVALQGQEQIATSMQILGRLLSGDPEASQRAKALVNMANAWVCRGNFSRSYECNLLATRADGPNVRRLAWCLTSALQGGDEDKTRESSALLEAQPQLGELASVAKALVDSRASNQWEPTVASRALVSRIRNDLAEPIQEICDAFV